MPCVPAAPTAAFQLECPIPAHNVNTTLINIQIPVERFCHDINNDSDLDETVVTGGGDPLAVRAEPQAVHRRAVSFIREDAALPSDVPQLIRFKTRSIMNYYQYRAVIKWLIADWISFQLNGNEMIII